MPWGHGRHGWLDIDRVAARLLGRGADLGGMGLPEMALTGLGIPRRATS